jgi:ATP-binding cassette subfamily B protein
MNVQIPFKSYWSLLARHIQPQRARFFLLAALLLGNIGMQIANPQIVRTFIDAATTRQAAQALARAAVAFIGVALLQQILGVAATYVGENVAWTATNALRAELARHCLRLDMGFHGEHTPGELIERIDGDVAELANFFSQIVVRVLGNLLLLVGVLIVLFVEEWHVGLAFTCFVILSLLALNRVRDIAVPHQKARRQASAELFGFLEEQLAGTEDVRSSGAVAFALRRLYELQYAYMTHNRKASMMGLAISMITASVLLIGNLMNVVSSYRLFTSGAITIGTVYMLVQYLNLLSQPIWELSHQVESLQAVGASTQRLSELRAVESRVQDGPGAQVLPGPLPLTFDHVSFAYVPGEPVLQDLSFHLPPGNVLGLLGRTGSGKTTLARLAVRLYDPTAGQITLGGVDLRQPTLQHLRQRVAIVTQDVQLFQASVRDNLTFFRGRTGPEGISDERIREAIEELELADWYRSLPEGLDTRLASGGRGLSAGEAQLLALTRVFLRDPGLVILDEASSRLDPATEGRIERAIDRLLRERTGIVIAHRLGTVQRADEIMILEDGQVSEHGERERLAGDPESRFHRLLQTGLEEVLV